MSKRLINQVQAMTIEQLLPLMAGVFQTESAHAEDTKKWTARVLGTKHHAYGPSAAIAMKYAYYSYLLEQETGAQQQTLGI